MSEVTEERVERALDIATMIIVREYFGVDTSANDIAVDAYVSCEALATDILAAVAPLIAKAERDRLIGVSPRGICWGNGDPLATKINPDATPDDYRDALMGIGPVAAEWQDKPHRLLYDLAGEVKRLQSELAALRALGDDT